MKLREIKISTNDLAELLGVHPGYISQLVLNHGFPKEEHNSYKLYSFIKRWREYQDEICEGRIQKIRETKPQDELHRKSAELKEIIIQEKKKTLLPKKEFEEAHLNAINIIKTSIDGWKLKVPAELFGMPDLPAFTQKFNEFIDGLLKQITDAQIKFDTGEVNAEPN